MSWIPKTDFEEEVVNLQPDHDFIYGTLSEPQYTYPRPQAHIEYAENRKIEKKNEQKNSATNKINAKLKAITQVQRMANTKPLGEQPALDDWDSNAKIEQEIVGMLRYHGLPLSIEQPLNEKVTISTFPVENSIKVVKDRRKNVAYFFDDKIFQLKQKVSDSSDFESCANDSLVSDMNEIDTSFNTSTSLSSHSPNTSCSSDLINLSNKRPTDQQLSNLFARRLRQYEKLLEDTASLSLSTNSAHTTSSTDSFKSAEECHNSWTPLPDDYDDENIVYNCKDWPDLVKNKNDALNLSVCSDNSNNKTVSDSNNISATDYNTSSSTSGQSKTNFLERFIKPEYLENSAGSTKSTSTLSIEKSSSSKPKTYASVTKEIQKTSSKPSNEINSFDFVPFYTPRKMYALKRRAK